MKHLNGNLLCAVDTETTGLDDEQHDIIQLAIIPLDGACNVSPIYLPFDCKIKPDRPENIDQEALRVNRRKLSDVTVNGLDSCVVADLLVSWFEKLRLAEGKKVVPLAHNWPFDHGFIKKWLGPATYSYIFSGHYRDTQAISLYLNDVADYFSVNWPFPKHSLRYVASQVGIFAEEFSLHDAVEDALLCAQVYKKMIAMKGSLGEM